MDDDQLQRYLPRYGDRVAATAFCRRLQLDGEDNDHLTTKEKREGLFEKVRVNIQNHNQQKRKGKNSRSESLVGNRNAKKVACKLRCGWLNYENCKFKQVRETNGGGTREMCVDSETTVSELLVTSKELFFPGGISKKGDVIDFEHFICDFNERTIPLDATVEKMYEEYKVKDLRIYLATKKKKKENAISSEEKSDDIFSVKPVRSVTGDQCRLW